MKEDAGKRQGQGFIGGYYARMKALVNDSIYLQEPPSLPFPPEDPWSIGYRQGWAEAGKDILIIQIKMRREEIPHEN